MMGGSSSCWCILPFFLFKHELLLLLLFILVRNYLLLFVVFFYYCYLNDALFVFLNTYCDCSIEIASAPSS
ncbi:hypothetical protein MIMGU_mgv11b016103mg [Erythranthe guttata]|uniref:Uncharacterized protein n=2 Tax=Erythranthe guttata TaxID=4155 RepID=A0A022QB79_ERYGU|nr:hypothetical protein MIMGU_mgv11b016103mg [Erythranthe guttata]